MTDELELIKQKRKNYYLKNKNKYYLRYRENAPQIIAQNSKYKKRNWECVMLKQKYYRKYGKGEWRIYFYSDYPQYAKGK